MKATLRLVSWNMGGQTFSAATHLDAWRHLLDVLRPDIALLQEARPLPEIVEELGPRIIMQAVSKVTWGSAIVVQSGPVVQAGLGLSTEWMDYVRVVAADVEPVSGSPLRVVSVHPHFERFDPSLLLQRPDLQPKLDVARSVWSCDVAYVLARSLVADRGAFVVAGDWNTARLFDSTSPLLDPGTGEAFFARAVNDGWLDPYHLQHKREGRTWFRGRDHGYQLDHLFTDAVTAGRATDAWVDERAAVDPRLSDHAPLVVDFA